MCSLYTAEFLRGMCGERENEGKRERGREGRRERKRAGGRGRKRWEGFKVFPDAHVYGHLASASGAVGRLWLGGIAFRGNSLDMSH